VDGDCSFCCPPRRLRLRCFEVLRLGTAIVNLPDSLNHHRFERCPPPSGEAPPISGPMCQIRIHKCSRSDPSRKPHTILDIPADTVDNQAVPDTTLRATPATNPVSRADYPAHTIPGPRRTNSYPVRIGYQPPTRSLSLAERGNGDILSSTWPTPSRSREPHHSLSLLPRSQRRVDYRTQPHQVSTRLRREDVQPSLQLPHQVEAV